MADFESRVRAALGSGEPLAELRRVLTEELDRGTAASELLAHLERMRADLGDEQEDNVLDGLAHRVVQPGRAPPRGLKAVSTPRRRAGSAQAKIVAARDGLSHHAEQGYGPAARDLARPGVRWIFLAR